MPGFRTTPRCPACPFTESDKIWPVPGNGPSDAEVMLIFEQPGKEENYRGKPMVGKSGEELNGLYLPLAGLQREMVWVDNCCRCKHADTGEAPPEETVRVCSEFHLRPLIQRIKPDLIILGGGVSNSLLDLDIELTHGTARRGKLFGHECDIFSSYHPALGIHQSSKMQNLLDDFRKLRQFRRGDISYHHDPKPAPTYYLLDQPEQVEYVLGDTPTDTTLAIDTESKKVWRGRKATIKYIPWSIQFAVTDTEGYLIKVSDEGAVEEFGQQIHRFRDIVMHNEPHDWEILRGLGLEIDWRSVTDTMSMLYNLARYQKGLKAAAYQLLGASMRNFDDVVGPYGKMAQIEYFTRASEMEWFVPPPEPTGKYRERKCQTCNGKGVRTEGRGKAKQFFECETCGFTGYETVEVMSQKRGIGTLIKLLMNSIEKNPHGVDPIKRWMDWEEDERAIDEVIERLGPPPLASVELVPEEEILGYGGADAVMTRRLVPLLRGELARFRAERWKCI